jgi:hypothetical protein
MNATILLPHSPVLGHVRWPSAEARAWVEDLLRRAADDDRVAAVVAYGSAVRDGVEAADVDLLIIASSEADAGPPPLDVDLRRIDPSDVEHAIAAGDEVLGWAARFGVPLVDKDGFWADLVARWTGRLPFPSAETADARADRAFQSEAGLRAAGDPDAADEMRLLALTQRARARLLRANVYPLSRPEIPAQLLSIGKLDLAAELSRLIRA